MSRDLVSFNSKLCLAWKRIQEKRTGRGEKSIIFYVDQSAFWSVDWYLKEQTLIPGENGGLVMIFVSDGNIVLKLGELRRNVSKSSGLMSWLICAALFTSWSCTASRPAVQHGKDREPGRVSADWEQTGGEDSGDMSEHRSDRPEVRPPQCPVESVVSIAPVIWDDETGHLRWWIGERVLDEVKSSKEKPVEVCGVRGQLQWLMNAVCPDGKRPFSSLVEAHQSRTGSVGQGGRCGKIVDLYRVPCETQVYEVYMSLYHCTRSERARGEGPPEMNGAE